MSEEGKTQEQEEGKTQEQTEQEIRDEVAAEVFEDKPPVQEPDLDTEEKEIEEAPEKPKEPEKEEEPQAGDDISALRKSYENLSAKLNGLDTITYRLKQTESRIGAIQNKLSVEEKKAQETPPAPTPEEIKQAAAEEESWKQLKDDFPDWTEAMETRFAKVSTGVEATQRKMESRIAEQEAKLSLRDQEIVALRSQMGEMAKTRDGVEKTLLSFKHPNWESDIKTPEYKEWIKSQADEVKGKTRSTLAKDAIEVLDKYNEFKKSKKSPAEIAEERKKRLQSSVSVKGKKPVLEKAEEDMSEDELREKYAHELWPEER